MLVGLLSVQSNFVVLKETVSVFLQCNAIYTHIVASDISLRANLIEVAWILLPITAFSNWVAFHL